MRNNHGMSNTAEYKRWKTIKKRCTNPNNRDYKYYKGKLHSDWEKDFMAFYNHIGPMPDEKATVDRIDSSKGYEPGNVRWISATLQKRNLGKYKNNKSGTTGVYIRQGKSAVGSCKLLNRKQKNREFSFSKYGEELAVLLAEEWRAKQIHLLNLAGAGYTSTHGK